MAADSDPDQQRLAKIYAGMTEGELRRAANNAFDLTDAAHQALIDEITRRSLDIPLVDSFAVDEVEQRQLVTVRHFRDLPEALLAKASLDSAGIECFLVDQNLIRVIWFYSNGIGGIKLQVNKADAEDAESLLNDPIPEAFDVAGVGTYKQPQCPHCRSVNLTHHAGLDARFALPVLWMSGIPLPVGRDEWKCESCGQEWLGSKSDEPSADPE